MRCRELRAPASRDAPTATNESLFLSPASLLLFSSLSASSFRTSHRNFTSVAPENYRDITPAPRRCVETARRKRGQEAQGCVTTAADGTQDYSPWSSFFERKEALKESILFACNMLLQCFQCRIKISWWYDYFILFVNCYRSHRLVED